MREDENRKKGRRHFLFLIGTMFFVTILASPISGLYLNDLEDVNVPSPSNNQVLKYDSATANWTAQTDATGGAGGNPFNQDLNTTDSPTFDDITLTSYPNLDKDSTDDADGYAGDIGHPHNQDLNTTNDIQFNSGLFNYIDKVEIAEPTTPSANTLRLFVMEEDGFSRYYYKDEHGVVRTFNDDEIIVKNIRGTTIAAHRLVYVSGNDGGIPTIDLAKADNIDTMPCIGVTIESIANNTYGRVMQVGQLVNVNTNSYDLGTIYVSDVTAGIPTNIPPVTPSFTQEIGTILVKNATVGKIQIISRALTGDEFGTVNNFTISENCTASAFFGDGGNLTNITASGDGYAGDEGHPHNQDLNTTDSPTFLDIVLTNFPNLDKDSTDDADGYAGDEGHPHNQDLNSSNSPTFNDLTLTTYPNLDKDSTNDVTSLNDLTDVLLSSLTDDDHLIYDSGSLKWKNEAFVGGADGYAGDEGHPHNQDLNTTDSPTFAQLTTGIGLTEVYRMNQDIRTSDAVTFTTLNTGQGANELYDMNQNVQTSDDVQFDDIYSTGSISVGQDTTETHFFGNSTSDDCWMRVESGDDRSSTGFQFQNYVTEWWVYSVGSVFALKSVDGSDTLPLQVEGAPTLSYYLDSSGYSGFGLSGPTKRISTQNIAGNNGAGIFNSHSNYCDGRHKSFFADLPKGKVLEVCRAVDVGVYRFIDTGFDEFGNVWFGDVTDEYMITLVAQDLYYDILEIFDYSGIGLRVANYIVDKPVDEDVEYWSLNNDALTMLFYEAWKINDERITYIEELLGI